jgi:large conductance mechanosensitive channel
MDMAVGVIVGAAFGKIVTSLVDDILMPIVGSITGGINVSGMSIKIGEATIRYGSFVQAAIDFFIIALCMFFVVKSFNKFKEKKEEVVPAKSAEVVLLEEIRDELKTAKK